MKGPHKEQSRRLTGVLLTGSWLCCGLLAAAAPPADPISADSSELTRGGLATFLEKVKSGTDLDAEAKDAAVALLTTALDDWDASLEADERRLRLIRQWETAASELDALRKKLSAMPDKVAVSLPVDADAEQWERKRGELERLLEQPEHGLRERISRLEQELDHRASRLETLSAELLAAEEKLELLRQEAKDLPDDEEAVESQVKRLSLKAALHRAEQDVAACEAERDWLESTDADRWIRTLKQLAEQEIAQIEDQLQQVDEQLEARRLREASTRVDEARKELAAVPAPWKVWAGENQQLAERSRQLTERIEQQEDEQQQAADRLESLERESADMREMVDAVGRNDAIGMMLRQHSTRLPDCRRLRSEISAREDELRELKLKRFELDRQRRQTPELETLLAAVTHSPAQASALTAQAEHLLSQRDELLEQLDQDYQTLFKSLVDLTQTHRKLLKRTDETARFYDEQMLWLRSGHAFGWQEIRELQAGMNWIANDQAWSQVPAALLLDLERRPGLWFAAAVGMWGILVFDMSRRRRAEAPSAAAGFSLPLTLQSVVTISLRAGVIPALMALLAWRLEHAGNESAWLQGVANGLWRCAAWAWPLLILRKVCRTPGLHLLPWELQSAANRRLSRRISWFLWPSLGLMFLVGATESSGSDIISDSLGRLAFLLLMGMTGWFCAGILTVSRVAPGAETSWPALGTVWLKRLIPWVPWGLAALAFAGYYDTALRLAWRLEGTAWLWLVLSGVHALGSRWLAAEQRRLELAAETPPADDPAPQPVEARRSLLSRWRERPGSRGLAPLQIRRQTNVLLQTLVLVVGLTGITALWRDVIPQGIWNQGALWQTTVTQQQVVSADDGNSTVRTVSRVVPITVFGVGLALLIGVVTCVAARNIPGLVEVLFLERLPLDVGGRFAVSILVRYALVVAGLILACAQIHVGWANVQWLVAAASVGLGFGLQEIFANFVSGIILLFERPIRVGDVITIGDTTGTVSQIRFRSTTILDADRKELVVPNKDLITGKLLNWTLSDQTNRVKLRVAVGFDSDPDRVRTLLQEIALAHPAVLKEPGPVAAFEEFGNTSLIFTLCVFLPSLDNRSKVIHELHSAIHARLHADGINLAVTPTAPKPAPPPQGVAA